MYHLSFDYIFIINNIIKSKLKKQNKKMTCIRKNSWTSFKVELDQGS